MYHKKKQQSIMKYDCVGIDLRVKEDPEDYNGKYVDCCGYIRDHPGGPVVGVFPTDDFKEGWQTTRRKSERIRKPIHKPDMLNTLLVIPDDDFYKRQQRVAIHKQRLRLKRRLTMHMKYKSYKKKRHPKFTYVGFSKPYGQK